MKLPVNNTGLTQIRFHQVFPLAQFRSDILEPLIETIHANNKGIMTLEICVLISCIILGITILMVIKQELFPKPRLNEEPPKTETSLVLWYKWKLDIVQFIRKQYK